MNQNHKTWEINGCSLLFDLEDLETVRRHEEAFAQMEEDEKKVAEEEKASDRILAYCSMYRKLYDRLFGDGTAERIFDGVPVNASVYDDVYSQFLEFVRKQGAETAKQKAERFGKYIPNRAQRRAKQ